MGIRAPKSDTQLRRLAELFCEVDGKIAAIEEARDAAIAAANAKVDEDLAPLLKERDLIEAKAGPYFMANREKLLPAKRKSVELGGAMLGVRKDRDRIGLNGDVNAMIEKLRGTAWGRRLVRVSHSLDAAKVKDAIEGKYKEALAEMGLLIKVGDETFYIKRTGQAGTQAKG